MNNARMDAAISGLAHEKKQRGHRGSRLHEAHVERAHGGYVVRHDEYRHKDGEVAHDHPMRGSKHVAPDMKALQAHMAEHMGDQQPDEPEQGKGAAPAGEYGDQ